MTRKPSYGVCILSLILAGGAARAQAPDGARQKFTEAQKQDALLSRQYGWKSRTELKVKNETKNVKVESVRYDNTGKFQKQVLENAPKDQADLLAALEQLAQSYAHMSPEHMRGLAVGAAISPGQEAMEGTTLVLGTNAIVDRDTVAVWVDASTFLFRQVKVNTLYENDPVNLTISYQRLPEGPSYPAQVDLTYPKKEVQMLIQNSNYQHLQR